MRTRALLVALVLVSSGALAADSPLPPWTDHGDVPLPSWARSVVPKGQEQPLVTAPQLDADRRGVAYGATALPLYGAARGTGCGGRYFQVGPSAWLCSDLAELSASEYVPPSVDGAPLAGSDGLPYRYYFVGKEGANAYLDLARAGDGAPDEQLDPGFAVAVVEERSSNGERWGRTHHGPWVALRDLFAARPSGFHGEERAELSFGWVLADRTPVYGSIARGKVLATRTRFEVVPVREERATPAGAMLRISEDGAAETRWIERRAVGRPTAAAPPADVGPGERWIDVELASQTLVAYEGPKAVYATLVSTGKGAAGSDTATHPGTHRIWVKLTTSTMDNLGSDDPELRYSMEDVPYVQFFDKGIALHAVFWHSDFGHVHSHGCVNLAPLDARWLFRFTGPRLPAGWTAVLPAGADRGTLVRVR